MSSLYARCAGFLICESIELFGSHMLRLKAANMLVGIEQ